MAWAAKGRLWAVLAILALGWHSVLPTRPREEMIPLGESTFKFSFYNARHG
ncbi:hypothetical protein E2C01_052139 [Portunus trituberculatus]|uniref:Uncharacterized protein n=1 Tax=Portunus trituberculatus TaxID=210409 RepID=A0A5B7GNK6_PORTR|nr:hypothetical protein [Portunus trituberculatus]